MKKMILAVAAVTLMSTVAVQSFASGLEAQKNDSGLKFSEMKLASQASPVMATGDFAPVKKAALTPVNKTGAKINIPSLKNNETPKKKRPSTAAKVIGGVVGGIVGAPAGAIALFCLLGAGVGPGLGAELGMALIGGVVVGGPIGAAIGVAAGIGAAYAISNIRRKK